MKDLSLYVEIIAVWLATMTAGLFIILFGKKILRWLLSVLYDLFISHRDGSSDVL